VLAVGFGPGVGVAALVPRLPLGIVGGIDPSSAMIDQARRRNRAAVNEGRVQLVSAGAEAIPWPDDFFDGAVAVNSIQLWQPFDVSLHEVARVLSPRGLVGHRDALLGRREAIARVPLGEDDDGHDANPWVRRGDAAHGVISLWRGARAAGATSARLLDV
jgi:ubiquinone/menaquinone biosynthesis C-methylase UbiE